MPALLANLIPTLISAVVGKKDSGTGEVIAKGLLTSKTMQGGGGLLILVSTGFMPGAISGDWFSRVMLVLAVICYGVVWYGRKTADKPLGKP